jgi:suppressor of fused-like protein
VLGDTAITLVAPSVTGTLVDPEHPYVAHGPWLQVLIPDDLAQIMSDSFEVLNNPEEVRGYSDYLISVTFHVYGNELQMLQC